MAIKQAGVYSVTCTVTGRMYIGSSIDLRMRRKSHFTLLKTGRHANSEMQDEYSKYGKNNFLWNVIEYCPPDMKLEREQIAIDNHWESGLLYNVTRQASSIGRIPPESTRRKMSEQRIGNKNSLGVKHSEETKKKMSEFHKGKVTSSKTKKLLSDARFGENNPFYGRTHSQETREKLGSKGERNRAAKLTWELVRQIRTRASNGEKCKDLAAEFGIRDGSMWKVISGFCWKE